MCLFSEKESTSSGTAGSQEAQQVEVQVQCSPGTENIILTPQAIHLIPLTFRVTHEQGKTQISVSCPVTATSSPFKAQLKEAEERKRKEQPRQVPQRQIQKPKLSRSQLTNARWRQWNWQGGRQTQKEEKPKDS